MFMSSDLLLFAVDPAAENEEVSLYARRSLLVISSNSPGLYWLLGIKSEGLRAI